MSLDTNVRFPEMRLELIAAISALSDTLYQKSVWGKYDDSKPEKYDSFDMAIHFLFDDTPLMSSPHVTIGQILRGQREVDLCITLANKLNLLFDRYGMELTEKEYIATDVWPSVIEAAKLLRHELTANC